MSANSAIGKACRNRRSISGDGEAVATRSRGVDRARRDQTDAAIPTPAFLPVRVVADEPVPQSGGGAQCLEVRLPTGVQLRVPGGFDRQTLVEVLVALEQRPC